MSEQLGSEDSLLKHLAALRVCLIRCFIGIGLMFCVTVYFSKDIFRILSLPMQRLLPPNSYFIATHPIEAWYTYMKTAAFSAVFLAAPIIFYQLWNFISPGLYKSEKRMLVGFALISSVFFIGGALFGYFVAFPSGFQYFTSLLQDTGILFLPRMEDYLGLAFQLLLGFGIIFETPLLMFFLTISGVVSFATLWRFQRYYILVAAVIAAILTPPDVFSQILMCIPMVLLYEIGLIGAWLCEKRKKAPI